MKKSILFLSAVISMGAMSGTAFAREGAERADFFRERRQMQTDAAKPAVVNWSGLVKCREDSHLAPHDCDLEFVREDGSTFDIVDSDQLKKEHCQTNSDLKVQMTGEITPRFLFWGGNLVVKDYKVLETQGQKVCELAYAEDSNARRNRPFGMERR